MSAPRCAVFDADSHLLEPPVDAFARYLDPASRASALEALRWDERGGLVLNGRRLAGAPASPLPRHALWRPGTREEDVGALDPAAPCEPGPGARDPRARLRDMDAMGIDAALLLPTLFTEAHPFVADAQAAAALARAYNRFAADVATAAPARLFPAAVLPLQDVDLALEELARAQREGYRAALLRPAFVKGRLPHHPVYHPLWKELESAGTVAVIHPAAGPAARELDANAPFVERVARVADIGHPVAEFVAPAMDSAAFLVALMADGLLERFPGVRLLFAHAGVSWLPLALEKAETYLWLSNQNAPVSLAPEAVFAHRACAVTFRAGDGCVRRMHEQLAPVAAFGSRYPGHDAADAWCALSDLRDARVPEPDVARLMAGNAAALLGVEVPDADGDGTA